MSFCALLFGLFGSEIKLQRKCRMIQLRKRCWKTYDTVCLAKEFLSAIGSTPMSMQQRSTKETEDMIWKMCLVRKKKEPIVLFQFDFSWFCFVLLIQIRSSVQCGGSAYCVERRLWLQVFESQEN
jgi:hypothetical protein